jgi:hypothetical protein
MFPAFHHRGYSVSFFDQFNYNIVSIILIGAFVIPVLMGIITPFSGNRLQRSFGALLGTLEWIIALILSIYLARYLLANNNLLLRIQELFPSAEIMITTRAVLVNIFLVVILMLINSFLLRMITRPLYRYIILPISNKVAAKVGSLNVFIRQLFGGLWNVPKAAFIVLILSFLLNVYANYFNNNLAFSESTEQSSVYQCIDEHITDPLLNTDLAAQIPVILNDSFQSATEGLSSDHNDDTGNTLVVKYFNGMTLEEAVESNDKIDATAKEIVGSVTDDYEKAYLLYQWICSNITYDDEKAALLAMNSTGIESGAIVTFQTKTGVCFDYSCLYVAMCRAVNIPVRFITGLAYNGTYWGDHAWNQIYVTEKDRWINVDTTFGSSGLNYFDKPNFSANHMDSVVQQEWDS